MILYRKGKIVQIKMFLPLHQPHSTSETLETLTYSLPPASWHTSANPSDREMFITSQNCGLCTSTWRNIEGLF